MNSATHMYPQELVETCDLGRLPSGPRVLSQLISAVRQPDAEIEAIAELFRADPALTARVVAACNSPVYSRGGATADIREAIMHLGMQEVTRIVQVVMLTDFKKHPTHLYTQAADYYWERSLHTALVMDQISGRDPSAYTAGIMHLVGVWVLCSVFPYRHLTINERELKLQMQLEELRLGVGFARAGSKAMDRWGFETEICAAVLWQLAPTACEVPGQRELSELLYRAVAIVDWHYGVRNEHTLIASDLTINDLEDCNRCAVEQVAKIAFGG